MGTLTCIPKIQVLCQFSSFQMEKSLFTYVIGKHVARGAVYKDQVEAEGENDLERMELYGGRERIR